MPHSIDEILSSISKQYTGASLTNVEGYDVDIASAEHVDITATVMSIKPDDFVKLPAEDQQALIDAGYDLRSFVNTTPMGMVSSMTMPPRIYVLRWSDGDGVHYAPLSKMFAAEERCNLAAYACGQLQNIVAGSQPMAESQPTLYEKMQQGRRTLIQEGVGYMLIPAENFSMNDMVTLYNQGWKVKNFNIDGQSGNYYYKVLTPPAVPIE